MTSKKLAVIGMMVVVFTAACNKQAAKAAPTGQDLPPTLAFTSVQELGWGSSVKTLLESKGIDPILNCARLLDYKDGDKTGTLVAVVKNPSCSHHNEPARADIVATFQIDVEKQFGIKPIYVESPEFPVGSLHAITNGSGDIVGWLLGDLCSGDYASCEIEENTAGMIQGIDLF